MLSRIPVCHFKFYCSACTGCAGSSGARAGGAPSMRSCRVGLKNMVVMYCMSASYTSCCIRCLPLSPLLDLSAQCGCRQITVPCKLPGTVSHRSGTPGLSVTPSTRPSAPVTPASCKRKTHLFPIPSSSPHPQRPILDRTRRQMIQHHMVRYGQYRIII